MNVKNVQKPLTISHPLLYSKKDTQWRTPVNAMYVGKPFAGKQPLQTSENACR
jgi:hypothetical protein